MAAVLPMLPALASPRRQEILRLVWDAERCAGDIHAAMPDITFGAVSLQLKALADAGLVTVRAEGRFRYYQARREALGPVRQELERVWDSALWRLTLHAELRQARRGPRPGTPRAPRAGASRPPVAPTTRTVRPRKGSS
jgi:DNA-binding transcriptional ArsR family regulator